MKKIITLYRHPLTWIKTYITLKILCIKVGGKWGDCKLTPKGEVVIYSDRLIQIINKHCISNEKVVNDN